MTECQNCQYNVPGDKYKPYFQSIGIHPPSYCDSCGSKFPRVKELTKTLRKDELSRTDSAQSWVESLLSRFHSIVKTLESRDRGKEPLKMQDEYDVQYLLIAL
ncbi:MAG: DUF2321 domain-containing protein [Nitrososphaeraceae archaeon]|nr:DUF2321 domain-containing protein [Nitrososphaeraceae archaeon]